MQHSFSQKLQKKENLSAPHYFHRHHSTFKKVLQFLSDSVPTLSTYESRISNSCVQEWNHWSFCCCEENGMFVVLKIMTSAPRKPLLMEELLVPLLFLFRPTLLLRFFMRMAPLDVLIKNQHAMTKKQTVYISKLLDQIQLWRRLPLGHAGKIYLDSRIDLQAYF